MIKAANSRSRRRLIADVPAAGRLGLAHALKDICYEVWSSEPVRARQTARALADLAAVSREPEIDALAAWTNGISQLTRGQLPNTIESLDRSAAIFRELKKDHEAANTAVAKIYVLALLGRYDEAVKTGKSALKVFEKYGDELSAGKVEKNIGNIVARQSGIARAEKYYLSAMKRFGSVGDLRELAMCETNLADNFADLNDFVGAEKYYELALRHARDAKLHFVEAEIEASMGNLAMFRGRYADALRLLETARRKFEKLRIAHRSVVADLEIADIYRTLNLTDEAFEIYARSATRLRRLKMRAEEAKTRADLGRTAFMRRDFVRAARELATAARLFTLERNPASLAGVRISEAELEFARGRFDNALATVRMAERLLAGSDDVRQKVITKRLRGEILMALGRKPAAERALREAFDSATINEQRALAQACLNSLGNLALSRGDRRGAADYYRRAVRLIENLRSPLAAEEFRMAFLADKLAPFESLARINLVDGELAKAFEMLERGRARTLAETVAGEIGADFSGDDGMTSELLRLREELNWFYSRLGRADANERAAFEKEASRREKLIADRMRRIESTRTSASGSRDRRDELPRIQSVLAPNEALVEFVRNEGMFSAFVVTNGGIDAVVDFVGERDIVEMLESLQFQFGVLRYGAKSLDRFMGELKRRTDAHLAALYDKLLAPLASLIGDRDLVVVPSGALHYVPFHALRNGERYLIETRTVVGAPAAGIWRLLAERPSKKPESALLVGFADEKIPLVEKEIAAIRTIFPNSSTLTGGDATFENYRRDSPSFDLLHLACHGSFRPDNPLFSSLHLADGLVTVRDICAQKLNASLVTLSACETGLNKISPGEEILGLARGFLAAGAESLVLSLWTVNDGATARLMTSFYEAVREGDKPSKALRKAQLEFVADGAHPYFWSPFTVIGK